MAKMAKLARNGFQLTSLIGPTILVLEESLLDKTFCSNIKLKMLPYKLFSCFKFELVMSSILASWRLGIFSVSIISST